MSLSNCSNRVESNVTIGRFDMIDIIQSVDASSSILFVLSARLLTCSAMEVWPIRFR